MFEKEGDLVFSAFENNIYWRLESVCAVLL